MDPAEIAALPGILIQTALDFFGHLVRIGLELFGAVVGQFGHGRLSVVPVARTVAVEISDLGAHAAQGIAEYGWRFNGLQAQFDAAVFQAATRIALWVRRWECSPVESWGCGRRVPIDRE